MKRFQFYNHAFHTLLTAFVFMLVCCLFSFSNSSTYIPEEICDNAVDDDYDGLIDLNDDDCPCEVITPVSLIPNPDFEEMDCCPDDRSQLFCATSWAQASEATTDYLHTCGWMGWPQFPPPLPFPSGEGIMGFRDGRVLSGGETDPYWKEYAGACLNETMIADSTYRMDFDIGFVDAQHSPPINITFFGTESCANLPFGIGALNFGCPTNSPEWIRLGSVFVFGGYGDVWLKSSIEVTPDVDIRAIAIGPDCPLVEADSSTYYFFDNLILDDLNSFDLQLVEVSHPCDDDFALKIPENEDLTFQWYKDGIALIGETNAQLSQMQGPGFYQVQIMDGTDCRLSNPYEFEIPTFESTINASICKNQSFDFGGQSYSEAGTYTDTIKTANNCDSIVTLNLALEDLVKDSILVNIFEGESYQFQDQTITEEGETQFSLTSSFGCDSLLLLRLEFYHIYFPNVFSPNQDGANDVFRVFGGEGLIEKTEILIYDRWGAQIYQGEAWDGRFRDKFVNPGVFVYAANLTMSDGITRQYSGSVTVLR